MPSLYSQSEEYKRFRNWVAQRKVIVEQSAKVWRYYDYGPKEATPLIMLHGASGTAEVFYKQIMSLCSKGYRVVAAQYPAYSSHDQWLRAFDKFVDVLKVSKVHLFGTALGGYLSLCYAQFRPNRVLSIILCNSFCDTQYYADSHPFAGMFSWTPDFILKRLLLQNFPNYVVEVEIANSIDFMVEQLESVIQEDLSSRLLLNCTVGPLVAVDLPLDDTKITIIDTLDDVALPERLRDEVYKIFPNARQALLKSGGNFPYLSRSDEFNLHIEVHLRHNHYDLQEMEEGDVVTTTTEQQTEERSEKHKKEKQREDTLLEEEKGRKEFD